MQTVHKCRPLYGVFDTAVSFIMDKAVEPVKTVGNHVSLLSYVDSHSASGRTDAAGMLKVITGSKPPARETNRPEAAGVFVRDNERKEGLKGKPWH